MRLLIRGSKVQVLEGAQAKAPILNELGAFFVPIRTGGNRAISTGFLPKITNSSLIFEIANWLI